MVTKKPRTFDLFAAASGRSLDAEWPSAHRFPLNQDAAHVEDIVLQDLNESEHPLIVTGFATLDRLINFVASADSHNEIRVVLGSEPFDSRQASFSIKGPDVATEIKEYWLERGISVLLSAKLLVCIERLKTRTLLARYVARSSWRLHAKIYVGDNAATIGSSNFTDPGLRNQLEANVRFQRSKNAPKAAAKEEHRRYLETKQIAEQFWALGTDYNDRLLTPEPFLTVLQIHLTPTVE